MQIMGAISHLFRIYQQTLPEKNFNLDKSNPDRLVVLLGQLTSVIDWLIKLRNDIQTEMMNQMQIDSKE
jgi:hypothetical protein